MIQRLSYYFFQSREIDASEFELSDILWYVNDEINNSLTRHKWWVVLPLEWLKKPLLTSTHSSHVPGGLMHYLLFKKWPKYLLIFFCFSKIYNTHRGYFISCFFFLLTIFFENFCKLGLLLKTLDYPQCKKKKKKHLRKIKLVFSPPPILIWFSHHDPTSTTLNSWLKLVNGVCYLVWCVISLFRKSCKAAILKMLHLTLKLH